MKMNFPNSILAVLASLAAAPALATDCWLRCANQAECRVHGVKDPIPQSRPITPSASCASLGKVVAGRIEALVRARGRVNVVFLGPEEDLATLSVRAGGKPDCSPLDRACREGRDRAMQAGRAGKPFDPSVGHKPTGSPCAIGLPCGVVLAPAAPWVFRLEEPRAADAVLQVAAMRMAGAGSIDVPVRDGAVAIEPGFLRAGASYSYLLRTAGGEVIAAGQFSVASTQIEKDLRDAEAAALAAGRAPATARLEALLVNELDWDAMQLSRR